MANCFIDFRCVQQDLARTDENTIAEGVAKVLYARFDLCHKWDGLALYARFKHMGAVYDVPIVDGCAQVPWEVVKYTGFEVSIFGEDAEGGRLTSAKVFNEVKRSIDLDGVQPIPATPTLLQRFEADAAAAKDAAEDARDTAENIEAGGGAPIIVDNGDGTFDLHYKYGMKEDVGSLKTDAWEFELPDGSVVRKDVVVKL